jgi:hypothetical protein
MSPYLVISIGSAMIGIAAGWRWRSPRAGTTAAAVSFVGVASWVLYVEYLVPYSGGGASMWPIAVIVYGTMSATIGWAVATLVARIRWPSE